MKKYLATIFCIVVLAVCFALPAYAMGSIDADSVVMSVDEMTCVNYALDYAEAYYNEIYGTSDTDGIFEFDVTTESELISSYIQQKNYYMNSSKRYGEVYTKYSGEFSLKDVKTVDDKIYCHISCIKNYAYKGRSKSSGSGNPMFFTFVKNELNEWVLRDVYERVSLDISLRGMMKFEQYIEEDFIVNEEVLSLIAERQSAYNDYANEVYGKKDENSILSVEENSDLIISPMFELENQPCLRMSLVSTGSFDRLEMAYYAFDNCRLDNPVSGNPSLVPVYYPFEDAGANYYDCTNFISHVLLSGGAIPYEAAKNNSWFFRESTAAELAAGAYGYQYSYSWSDVQNFYKFVTDNDDLGLLGPFGIEVPYIESVNALFDMGDIIQISYNNGVSWGHSTVITGYDVGGTYVPLITSRTDDEDFHDDDKLTDANVYAGDTYRVIKLNGFRY